MFENCFTAYEIRIMLLTCVFNNGRTEKVEHTKPLIKILMGVAGCM